MYNLLLILHVSCAALWLGGPLFLGRVVRTTAALGQPAFKAGAELVDRMALYTGIGTAGVLATGIGLIFAVGGMGAIHFTFHIALLLGLIATGLAWGLLKPTAGKLVAAASAADFSADKVEPIRKRLAMAVGITHLIWLVCLVLMMRRAWF